MHGFPEMLLVVGTLNGKSKMAVSPNVLNASILNMVESNAISITDKSWQYGTLFEAQLEYFYPSLSIFGSNPFAVNPVSPSSMPTKIINGITPILDALSSNSTALIQGDGSSADPASIGSAAFLTSKLLSNQAYDQAVTRQLDHLLRDIPRTPLGAISHREEEVQLWSDFVYMAPPFLAYYGAMKQNLTVLSEAYNQCRLYREAMIDSKTMLWKHVQLGSWNSSLLWATGNAWAAAGMLRVAVALQKSTLSATYQNEIQDLKTWISETLRASWKTSATATPGLFNDLAKKPPKTFVDMAGTALMISTTYRMAYIFRVTETVRKAEQARLVVQKMVDANGWLQNITDPFNARVMCALPSCQHSAEAQSFVLMMTAAWKEWVAAGSPGL